MPLWVDAEGNTLPLETGMLYLGLLTMLIGASTISRHIIDKPRGTSRPSLGAATSLILTGIVLILTPNLVHLLNG